MPVTKVAQISASKCTKSVWRLGPARKAYSTPPDLLAGFKSEGRQGKEEGVKHRRG